MNRVKFPINLLFIGINYTGQERAKLHQLLTKLSSTKLRYGIFIYLLYSDLDIVSSMYNLIYLLYSDLDIVSMYNYVKILKLFGILFTKLKYEYNL